MENIKTATGVLENIKNIEPINNSLTLGEKYLKIFLDYLGDFWPKLVGAILILWIGFKLTKFLNKFISKAMDKSSLDPMLKTFLLSFIGITLKILIILTAVGTLGVKTTSFIALFTAAGVAIGMSLSGTLQNFAGGMIILAFRLYKIGDYISIGGFEGTVKSIHIFHTIVLTLDRKTIIFPNSKISNGTMINFSTEKIRRMDLNLNIGYNEDLEFVKKVIKEVFLKDERILIDEDKDFDLNIFVNEIKGSGIMLTVRYFVESKLLLKVKSEIYEKVLVACKENNIDLSYGQFDIKMIK